MTEDLEVWKKEAFKKTDEILKTEFDIDLSFLDDMKERIVRNAGNSQKPKYHDWLLKLKGVHRDYNESVEKIFVEMEKFDNWDGEDL